MYTKIEMTEYEMEIEMSVGFLFRKTNHPKYIDVFVNFFIQRVNMIKPVKFVIIEQ